MPFGNGITIRQTRNPQVRLDDDQYIAYKKFTHLADPTAPVELT